MLSYHVSELVHQTRFSMQLIHRTADINATRQLIMMSSRELLADMYTTCAWSHLCFVNSVALGATLRQCLAIQAISHQEVKNWRLECAYSRWQSVLGLVSLRSLEGSTARPGGLHARLCHAFLVCTCSHSEDGCMASVRMGLCCPSSDVSS